MQGTGNSGPSNMHILVFFDHNNRLMFHSSCFVGFHTKHLFILSFLVLNTEIPLVLLVCLLWMVDLILFIICLLLFQFFLNSPTVGFSVLFFFLPSLDLIVQYSPLLLSLSSILCPSLSFVWLSPIFRLYVFHLLGCIQTVADIRGEIRRSGLIEANLHSQAPQRELYSNRGCPAYQGKVLSFRPNTLQLL